MQVSNSHNYLCVKRIWESRHDTAYALEFLGVRVVTCHQKWTVPATYESQNQTVGPLKLIEYSHRKHQHKWNHIAEYCFSYKIDTLPPLLYVFNLYTLTFHYLFIYAYLKYKYIKILHTDMNVCGGVSVRLDSTMWNTLILSNAWLHLLLVNLLNLMSLQGPPTTNLQLNVYYF
jgi:hypothetical protein